MPSFGNYKNMIKKLILFAIIFTELIVIKPWTPCVSLKNEFNFSYKQLTIEIDDAIHNDSNLPIVYTRFFHNKPVFLIRTIINKWLNFFDINFLINSMSPIGFFGLLLGFWYIVISKKILVFSYIALFIVIIPFFEIVLFYNSNILLKFIYIFLPRILLSVWAFNKFLSDKISTANKQYYFLGEYTKEFFIIVIIFFSILWFSLFQDNIKNIYCFV